MANQTAEQQDLIPPLSPTETSQCEAFPGCLGVIAGLAWSMAAGRGQGTVGDRSLPTSIMGLGRESGRDSVGMQTAARWMQQAAKLVASSERQGWASGRELPATCTAVSLRSLEKGPNRSPFWKNSKLEPIYSTQL